MSGQPLLPKPEIRGVGHVQYRCSSCDELMEPEDALIVNGLSYHPDHVSGDVAPGAAVADGLDGGSRDAKSSR